MGKQVLLGTILGRWATYAAVAALCVVAAAGFADQASAYSASQAEAQSDPTTDPYTFPNIKLCCGIKAPVPQHPCSGPACARPPVIVHPHPPVHKPRPRIHRPRHYPHHEGPAYHQPEPVSLPPLHVGCGGYAPVPGAFPSLQPAIHAAQAGQTIKIHGGFPGPNCFEHHPVVIAKAVRIVGATQGPNGSSRPVLEWAGGTCLSVQGHASASIENVEIVTRGGGVCIEQAGGRLDLVGVQVNAPLTSAAIAVSQGLFATQNTNVITGGMALAASNASVVLKGSTFTRQPARGIAAYVAPVAYVPEAAPPPATFQPVYAPGLGAIDPNAPYNGGGGGPAVFVRAHGAPQPQSITPVQTFVRDDVDGRAVVLLNASRAELGGVSIAGGPVGLQALMYGSNTDRPVTLNGVTVSANTSGKDAGIQVLSNGGYGYPSAFLGQAGVSVAGYRTGIEVRAAIAEILGSQISANRDGIVIDEHSFGRAEGNAISHDDDCICIGGDCSDKDFWNGRFTARGNQCRS